MLNIRRNLKDQSFQLPISGYLAYFITKFFQLCTPVTFLHERFETLILINEIRKFRIERPIYITGLARSGTTIMLEMLSKHPYLASHQYKNLLIPHLPYWLYQISNKLRLFSKPVERVHQDGIMVTIDSPEAVEEIFWKKYFKYTRTERFSHIINKNTVKPKFEKYYSNHIRKLLIAQDRPQYLAKNNYNITRMEYLQRIFPSSKFLLIIRNPVDQIASLIKQTKLFMKIEKDIPLFQDWLKILGHQEFGYQRICINVNNPEVVYKIRKLWSKKKTYVKGWAHYWVFIYDFIAKRLEENDKLRKATLIVNYDELCDN
ncbi:MAG: sulfotransferase, partial [Promethearchaeota archaeon]